MNNSNPIDWQVFKNLLLKNQDKVLQFQYAEGQFVDASYHITEIKQAVFVSVDCGGMMNSWTEIIVQLWEPPTPETDRAMKVGKALSIVSLVEKSLSLDPLAVVKIEFGNSKFDTRQMFPSDFISEDDSLIINLAADFTQCKATGRGQSCGTTPAGEECCTPANKAVVELKPVQMLEAVGAENQSCKPGSGCC